MNEATSIALINYNLTEYPICCISTAHLENLEFPFIFFIYHQNMYRMSQQSAATSWGALLFITCNHLWLYLKWSCYGLLPNHSLTYHFICFACYRPLLPQTLSFKGLLFLEETMTLLLNEHTVLCSKGTCEKRLPKQESNPGDMRRVLRTVNISLPSCSLLHSCAKKNMHGLWLKWTLWPLSAKQIFFLYWRTGHLWDSLVSKVILASHLDSHGKDNIYCFEKALLWFKLDWVTESRFFYRLRKPLGRNGFNETKSIYVVSDWLNVRVQWVTWRPLRFHFFKAAKGEIEIYFDYQLWV
jgi:hypothetical protein